MDQFDDVSLIDKDYEIADKDNREKEAFSDPFDALKPLGLVQPTIQLPTNLNLEGASTQIGTVQTPIAVDLQMMKGSSFGMSESFQSTKPTFLDVQNSESSQNATLFHFQSATVFPIPQSVYLSLPQIQLTQVNSLPSACNFGQVSSLDLPAIQITSQMTFGATNTNADSTNSSNSVIELPFAIKVNEYNFLATAQSLNNTGIKEREPELNLKDLDSPDEDLSAEPLGGGNDQLQQYKKAAVNYQQIDDSKLLGRGCAILPDVVLKYSESSGQTTKSSENRDQVQVLKFKKTKSQAPIFNKDQEFSDSLNDILPYQFQFSSYSQAQHRIEELYGDLQKVVKIAKQYRQDFLALQSFIKNHFKSADLLFKNSDYLTDSSKEERMVNVLQSCFQETPCIAMAFASPLCRRVIDPVTQVERVDIVPLLDFAKEFQGAVQGIEETGNQINVHIVPATLEKFTNCLMQKPIGLHFTGHGVENNAANLGQDTFLMQNQGKCLVFEKEDASAHFVSQQKLKDLFEMHVSSLKFVFIATCHSEFAGEIFHNAGVDHVICVKQGNTIMDEAAIFFARKFYQTLFMEKYTICDSFKMAKNCLKMHPVYKIQQEADKIIMILNTDEVKSTAAAKSSKVPGRHNLSLEKQAPFDLEQKQQKKEHKCCVLGPFIKREPELQLIESKPTYPFEVAKITEFVGRQREMQEIIACVLKNRLTTVLGVPGIGKTTICKSIGFHLAERKTFHDGIMFFTTRGKDQTSSLIQMMFFFIQKYDPTYGSSSKNSSQSMMEKNRLLKQHHQATADVAHSGNQEHASGVLKAPLDYQDMEQKIHEYLEAKQALIIIDNLEDVLREDEKRLRNFLTAMLEKLPGIQILITSRQKIQNLGEITECIYPLKQLTNDYSIQLLAKKALRVITEDEIKELFDVPAPMQQVYKTPFHKSKETIQKKRERKLKIEDHHLALLLGGHPHAISLVAPFLQGGRRLADLYKMLLHMIESEDFMKDIGHLDPTQSLKVSMDTSTMHMRTHQPEALNLFCLLGMLPGGVCDSDLTVLVESGKWLALTEYLVKASLVVDQDEKTQRSYRLLPFMNKYAESLLSPFDRMSFHSKCCQWLLSKVMKIFRHIKTEEAREQTNLVIDLRKIETNIWACIYRICDFSRDRNASQKLLKLKDQENSHHQHHLTGYSSPADEYEVVLLKSNLCIIQTESSGFSSDEIANRNLLKSDETQEAAPQAQDNNHLETTLTSPLQHSFSFNSSLSKGILREASNEGQDPINASKNSLKDQASSSQLLGEPLQNSSAQEISERPLENLPNEQFSDDEHSFVQEKGSSGRRVQFALNALNQCALENQINQRNNSSNSIARESSCNKQSTDLGNKLTKCLNQDFNKFNLVDDFEDQSPEFKRQRFITDTENLQDKQTMLVQDRDPSLKRSELVKGDTIKQIFIQQTLVQKENKLHKDKIGKGGENVQDITYSRESEEKTAEITNNDSNEKSKTISSQNKSAQQSEESLVQQLPKPLNTGVKTQSIEIQKQKNPAIPHERPHIKPIFKQRVNNGISLALKSTLEPIQERYEMSNDSLLIVAYISILVLKHKYSDAIRAIQVVNSSLPTDLLLLANLYKLNAISLLKQEKTKFNASEIANQAYRQFEQALNLFEKIGRKSNTDNSGNQGKAICLFGMGYIMFHKIYNFISKTRDEDACLRTATTYFEQAIEIFKKRDHLGGAAHCLQNLALVKKKLSQNSLHLTQEAIKLRKRKCTWPADASEADRVPQKLIYRHDGWDISILIEIVDSYQITLPNTSKAKRNLMHPIQGNQPFEEQTKKKDAPPLMVNVVGRKKQDFSPRANDEEKSKIQNQVVKDRRLSRSSAKEFASQTRKPSSVLQPKATLQKLPQKTMQKISQKKSPQSQHEYGAAANPSATHIQSHYPNSHPSQAASDFLSENSAAETEIEPLTKNAARLHRPMFQKLIVTTSRNDETQADIKETLQKRKKIAERQQAASKGIEKSKKMFEDKLRRQGVQVSPRTSIKKSRLGNRISQNADQHEEQKTPITVTRQKESNSTFTVSGWSPTQIQKSLTSSLQSSQQLTQVARAQAKVHNQYQSNCDALNQYQSNTEGNSNYYSDQQQTYDLITTGELQLDMDFEDMEMQRQSVDLTSYVYEVSMTSDVMNSSQINSSQMNSSFTTNDERIKHHSNTGNKDYMHVPTIKVNKKYAHIKSKIAALIHHNSVTQKPMPSQQDTPVANKESADEHTNKKPRKNSELNPFNLAEDIPADQQVETKESIQYSLCTTGQDQQSTAQGSITAKTPHNQM